MSRDIDQRADQWSPISRRAFFRGLGTKALKLGILGAAAASLGSDNEGGCTVNIPTDCVYCDGAGQDYSACGGECSDYTNYGDHVPADCGYCDAAGQDYELCGDSYCDYTNYSDAV